MMHWRKGEKREGGIIIFKQQPTIAATNSLANAMTLQRKMLLHYKREKDGNGTTREGQQENKRGAVQGEPGAVKKSSNGEVNGAKNTTTNEAKKNLANKAKTTAEKVSPPIL